MKTIFIDSTETVKSLGFKSDNLKKLLQLSKDKNVKVVIPEVVLGETLRQWKEDYSSKLNEAKNFQKVKKFLEWTGQERDSETRDDIKRLKNLSSWSEEPEPSLLSRENIETYLNKFNVIVAPLPSIPIEDILKRDLENRKPFKISGTGFRDTLIWETIKEHIRNDNDGGPFYLVSSNTSDFTDDKKKKEESKIYPALSKELKNELKNEDLSEVTWVINLKKMLEIIDADMPNDKCAEEEPTVEILHHKEQESIDYEIYISCMEIVNRELINEEINSIHNEYSTELYVKDLHLPTEIESAYFDDIELEKGSLELDVYDKIDDIELCKINIDAYISFSAYVHKSDQYTISDKEYEDYELVLAKHYHNRHYIELSGQFKSKLEYQIQADLSQGIIDSIELQTITRIRD